MKYSKVIAYIMETYCMDFKSALNHVQQKRCLNFMIYDLKQIIITSSVGFVYSPMMDLNNS